MAAGDPTAGKHALRVLVVDDNQDAADTLAVLLRLWGYDCRVNYDGASVLQSARDYRPHCLLLDISMPAMDGYTVARQIRQQPELGSVKLVALTAYSDETHAQRIQEAGFDHHVVKSANPGELEKLLTTINEELRLASQTQQDVTQE